MKIFKYGCAAVLVVFLLLVVVGAGMYIHNNNYSGTVTEYRDLHAPAGFIFSLDGKYPMETMLVQVEESNLKKFLLADGNDTLPHDGDRVYIKGHVGQYTGQFGIVHRIIVVTDPSQVVIVSRPAKK